MKNNDLLENAFRTLSEQYQIVTKRLDDVDQLLIRTYKDSVAISFQVQNVEYRFNAVIMNRVDNAMVALYLAKTRHPDKNVIITPYVSPNMADHLRQNNISFIDTSGNLFLSRPPLFMFVKGNKKMSHHKPVPVIRAFKAGGLKVLFTLLSLPDSEKKPYRELAFFSNVSVGTVDWVMKDLKSLGYLAVMGKQGRRMMKKKELVDRWVASFPEQLRTKLNVKTFRAENTTWWKNDPVKMSDALWSGEAAAVKMTGYLMPQLITLYTKAPCTGFVVAHKLRKDDQGNVEILDKFWNFEQQFEGKDTVPPLLVYADLMATGDARNVETARIIFHDYIAQLIRED